MGKSCITLLLLCGVIAGVSTGTEARPEGKQNLQIGVGLRDANRFCFAVEEAHLGAGTRVVVVSPLNNSWGEAAVVEAAKQPCPGTSDSPGFTSYELRSLKGELQNAIALVAVVGGLDGFAVAGSNVTASRGKGETATFRGCLADGGVYFTLWSGKPLEGELLWHGFRFVDFDMDAENCTPKDQPK